jgi:glycine cleavage system H protein
MDANALRYAETHEWARLDGDLVTVGLTQYAVDQLTDVTHLQLPKVGTAVQAGKPFGEIESVKAVFDLNAPVTGAVAEVNDKLMADPSAINIDCYGPGWMIKIQLAAGATLDHLLTKPQYDSQLAEDGH